MNKLAQLWLAGLAIVVTGCIGIGSDQPQLTQYAGNLESVCGSKWELKRLRINGEGVGIEDTERFTFLCNREGNVMGKSGVNTYRGAMQITDNGLILWDTSSFASTKMAAPEPLLQQENQYLRALAGTRQAFTKSGGERLILRDPPGDIYIEYVKIGI
ncbi:META domain-containing protein [Microbulbifer yueqingensis]|uniref:Heat shock protein HslJ n=1 Tax=Microbulbifer yueqingensis TaxID=658219 RepID=A0A1G9DKF5_9GAMM|nr:META domain-containing protein [Microbulbifer yueqingensis]SDK64324.1 Heat shock protein HslJ [Microbulbifer yueqingensis]